jgi:hypothetical protein
VDNSGTRTNGVNSGSRTSNWNNYPWNSNWNIGLRAACDDEFYPHQIVTATDADQLYYGQPHHPASANTLRGQENDE